MRKGLKDLGATLLVMAAGMASRYGGNKQLDGMGPHGEILLEYSIYDAMQAGFDHFVFVLKPEFTERFNQILGDRLSKRAKVDLVYQDFASLPAGYQVPAERTKPFGTVHAVLCAMPVIHGPFAVINADDYYGPAAFPLMLRQLSQLKAEKHGCMVAYQLKNTVSENGSVTRGVCTVREDGTLAKLTETYKIMQFPDGSIRDTATDPDGVMLNPDSLVSMNFFGFTPWLLAQGEAYFARFLQGLAPDELKKEYVLPVLVDDLMREQSMRLDVTVTDSVWFGVTYQQDKPYVQAELKAMHDKGIYPDTLF